MTRKVWMLTLLLLGSASIGTAWAQGSLRVAPLLIEISGKKKDSALSLYNFGKQATAVEASIVSWRQENGRDIYEPTKDIFHTPPLFSLDAKEQKNIRLRLRAAPDADRELAYRIYVQEVTVPDPQGEQSGTVQVRIRLGVPIFVASVRPSRPDLRSQISRDGHALGVDLENIGNAHIRIDRVELFPEAVDKAKPGSAALAQAEKTTESGYLLGGSRGTWRFNSPPTLKAGPYWIRVQTNSRLARLGEGTTVGSSLWLAYTVEAQTPSDTQ